MGIKNTRVFLTVASHWPVIHVYMSYCAKHVVVTDHKLLVLLFNKSQSKPPERIENWIIKLQRYLFIVEYSPGHDNPSDYMSLYSKSTKDSGFC